MIRERAREQTAPGELYDSWTGSKAPEDVAVELLLRRYDNDRTATLFQKPLDGAGVLRLTRVLLAQLRHCNRKEVLRR